MEMLAHGEDSNGHCLSRVGEEFEAGIDDLSLVLWGDIHKLKHPECIAFDGIVDSWFPQVPEELWNVRIDQLGVALDTRVHSPGSPVSDTKRRIEKNGDQVGKPAAVVAHVRGDAVALCFRVFLLESL